MNVQEVAELCFTSSATISRMAKKTGYGGFNALKEEAHRSCSGYFQDNRLLTPEQLINVDTTEKHLTTLIEMYMELNRTLDRETIRNAEDLIAQAEYIYYFGTCDDACRFQQDLNYSGKYVEVYAVFSAGVPQFMEWGKNSVALVENPGYLWFRCDDTGLAIKESGTKVILMTCSPNPELEEKVDVVLSLPG